MCGPHFLSRGGHNVARFLTLLCFCFVFQLKDAQGDKRACFALLLFATQCSVLGGTRHIVALVSVIQRKREEPGVREG
jgi:hypothetical protein